MTHNIPTDTPRITPYLLYEDATAAVDWLTKTFGFTERSAERMTNDEGSVIHSCLLLGDGQVMLGHPGPDYRSPHDHGQVCQQVYVYVEDVDAHHAHALSCGAKIVSGPEDVFYGDRRYTVDDPEGHRWTFATRVKDVPPEDWQMP